MLIDGLLIALGGGAVSVWLLAAERHSRGARRMAVAHRRRQIAQAVRSHGHRVASAPVLLFVALSVYGALASPTADAVGIAEVATFGLLAIYLLMTRGLLAVASSPAALSMSYRSDPRLAQSISLWRLSLVLVLVPGLAMFGLNNGSTVSGMRDIIAVALPFSAIAFYPAFLRTPGLTPLAASTAIGAAGVLLAIRHVEATGVRFTAIGTGLYNSVGEYFSTDPSVLFAAIFFSGLALTGRVVGWRLLAAGGCGAFCFAVLALKGHRAHLVLGVLALTALVVVGPGRRGTKLFGGALAAATVLYLFQEQATDVVDLLIRKTENRGLAGRDAEFAAVVRAVWSDQWAPVFGHGLGAEFSNPVTGGNYVRFTHLSFTYFMLKAGVLGILGFSIYLVSILPFKLPAGRDAQLILTAALPPVLIGVVINGSFRYLPFGVLLALILYARRHTTQPLDDPPPRQGSVGIAV